MKKILIAILSIVTFISCSIDEELNNDLKHPGNVIPAALFTNGTRNFFDYLNSASVNRNVFRLYSQYWAQTTYPDESQYNQIGRKLPDNAFRVLYRDALKDLEVSKQEFQKLGGKDSATKVAIIEVTQVYIYSMLVDMFGNVPYSESLKGIKFPKYDDAKTIYLDLFKRLNKAIKDIDASKVVDMGDPVYFGKAELWKKAANSLKLRMAMRFVSVDNNLAKEYAKEASSELISSNEESFGITYYGTAPNTNPLWVALVQSGRDDFVASNTMVDIMNDFQDPRLAYYFEKRNGKYIGGIYGKANSSNNYSAISEKLKDPKLKGCGISYAEVQFLLAEAAQRGYISGSAQDFYNKGVEASILQWGGTAAIGKTYLKNPKVAYDSTNWEEKLATQKWIALYENGFEGWCNYRLFDYPTLNEVSDTEGVPTRFLYPENENGFNGKNKADAIQAMGIQGNGKYHKIFWDKK